MRLDRLLRIWLLLRAWILGAALLALLGAWRGLAVQVGADQFTWASRAWVEISTVDWIVAIDVTSERMGLGPFERAGRLLLVVHGGLATPLTRENRCVLDHLPNYGQAGWGFDLRRPCP